MGNACGDSNVLGAQYDKFQHLQKEEQSESTPKVTPQTQTTHFKNPKKKEGHGPDPEEGVYVSQPVLAPQITQHTDLIGNKSISNNQLSFGSDITIPNNNLRGLQKHNSFKFHKRGVIYEGEWRDHKPHGFGKNYYADGSFFIGDFTEGIPNGHGRFFRPNGDYYDGQIRAGRATGNGTFKSQQYTYRGRFLDDKPHGKGFEKGNSYTFEGEFERGSKVRGVMKWDNNSYEGEFENDLFEGKGKLITHEGTYEGSFKQGLKHGQGEHKWTDGSSYSGEYQNDKKSGYGKYQSADGKYEYIGYWSEGVQHGGGACKINGDEVRGKWNRGYIVETH